MSNTKSSSSGCFSAVFRRLLCAGSPQTHPSDHNAGLKPVDDVPKVQVQASETGPGIVARLMGLESLPERNWVLNGKTPGPVTRSRSVNFVDYMLDFDSAPAGHRRVRTSVSFREILPQRPRVLQQNDQNHEFLVVYMDQNKETERKSKSQRRDGSGCKQKENVKKGNHEKNKKISKLKNEPRKLSGKQSSKSSKRDANSRAKTPLKEVSFELKTKTIEKKQNQRGVRKVENSENNSEGSSSSPVSVLNLNDFAAAHQENNSLSEDSKSLEQKLEKNFEPTDNDVYYMELVDNPCKLTDKDIKFSKKVFTFQEFEDICVLFEEQILDLLLHQVADELLM